MLDFVAGSPSHHNYIDYRIRSTAVNRLQIIIKLTEKWCITKSELFLSSYKIAPFVLITHGDLVVSFRQCISAIFKAKPVKRFDVKVYTQYACSAFISDCQI